MGFSLQVKAAAADMLHNAFYQQVLIELNEAADAGNVSSSERYDIGAEVESRTNEVIAAIFSNSELRGFIEQNEPPEGADDTGELPKALAEEIINRYFSPVEADDTSAAA